MFKQFSRVYCLLLIYHYIYVLYLYIHTYLHIIFCKIGLPKGCSITYFQELKDCSFPLALYFKLSIFFIFFLIST